MEIILLVMALMLSMSVKAQDFQALIGDSPFDTSLGVESLFSGAIKEHSFSAAHGFKRVHDSKIGLFTRYVELANSDKEVPSFYNIQFGLTYKHYLENDRFWSVAGSFGSASDRPFKDNRDSTIMINGTYRYSEKWIWLLNISNNRAYLNNVPLPGFIYVHEQGREKSLMLGFPFLYLVRPLGSGISINYVTFVPYNHKLKFLYTNLPWFRPYVYLEQGPQIFFDSNRESNRDRTFWFERKAAIGAEKSFGPFLKIDLQAGRSFDREYFQAQTFSRKHSNIIKVDDGTYVALNLKSMF